MKKVIWDNYFSLIDNKIYWLKRNDETGESMRWNSRHAGKEAGTELSKGGYLVTRLKIGSITISCYNHRIIYEMRHGEIPEGMFIDHIDHNRQNNRDDNHRLVTQAENNRNASVRKDSSTGVCGVTVKGNKFIARYQIDGRRVFLGSFDTIHEAEQAIIKSNRENKFHKNHGGKK